MGIKTGISLVLFLISVQVGHAARVTIDPGHSADSPGATGCSGTPEYRYNRQLGETVGETLQKAGVVVLFTTAKHRNPSLAQRAESAQGSDLLISLHHDSVQPQFVIRNKSGGVCSDKAAGFSLFLSTRNPAYLKSLEYATRLAKALKARGLTPTLHHAEPIPGENRILLSRELGIYQYDELRVLKTRETPAILLEAAVIVNRNDEQKAASHTFRTAIAEAILETIRQGAHPCKESCQLPSSPSSVHISPLLPALTAPKRPPELKK